MGRTRAKASSKLSKVQTNAVASASKPIPSVESLITKVHSLVVQCDYELASRFVQRVLERESDHAEARELLGVIQLEMGNVNEAKSTFELLANTVNPAPPAANLYLAQLADDPKSALLYYQNAVDTLCSQIDDSGTSFDQDDESRRTAIDAIVSMVEIWMSDLCDELEAESTCENLLNRALGIDSNSSEALGCLASVRISQCRPDEAKEISYRAWEGWKSLEPDDPKMPPIGSRLALSRLFVELESLSDALIVLQGVLAEEDEELEAWYIQGWCLFLMANKSRGSGAEVDGLDWHELAQDSRDCLERCQSLHSQNPHPNMQVIEHVRELVVQLEGHGIQPSQAEGDDEGDDWEDVESDDDIDMN